MLVLQCLLVERCWYCNISAAILVRLCLACDVGIACVGEDVGTAISVQCCLCSDKVCADFFVKLMAVRGGVMHFIYCSYIVYFIHILF